jgi:hypothetical protein
MVDNNRQFRVLFNQWSDISQSAYWKQERHRHFEFAAPLPQRLHQLTTNPVATAIGRRTEP